MNTKILPIESSYLPMKLQKISSISAFFYCFIHADESDIELLDEFNTEKAYI